MLGWPGTKVCPCNMTQRSRTRTTAFYPMIPFILVILSHKTILLAFPRTFPILLSSLNKEWHKRQATASFAKLQDFRAWRLLGLPWPLLSLRYSLISATLPTSFSRHTNHSQDARLRYPCTPGNPGLTTRRTLTSALSIWDYFGYDLLAIHDPFKPCRTCDLPQIVNRVIQLRQKQNCHDDLNDHMWLKTESRARFRQMTSSPMA